MADDIQLFHFTPKLQPSIPDSAVDQRGSMRAWRRQSLAAASPVFEKLGNWRAKKSCRRYGTLKNRWGQVTRLGRQCGGLTTASGKLTETLA
jgi:hypothetical protein